MGEARFFHVYYWSRMPGKETTELDLATVLGAFSYPMSFYVDNGKHEGKWRVQIHGYLTDEERDLLIEVINHSQNVRRQNGQAL